MARSAPACAVRALRSNFTRPMQDLSLTRRHSRTPAIAMIWLATMANRRPHSYSSCLGGDFQLVRSTSTGAITSDTADRRLRPHRAGLCRCPIHEQIYHGFRLDIEKIQNSYFVVNGRSASTDRTPMGRRAVGRTCSTRITSVAFDAPLQGSNTTRGVEQGFYLARPSCSVRLPSRGRSALRFNGPAPAQSLCRSAAAPRRLRQPRPVRTEA
jgi:hypothetical protein